MKPLTSVFKALSERNRLMVFAALMKHDELCACQIIEFLNLKGATVSKHMGVLLEADLVKSRKEGRWVYYRLNRENKEMETLYKWVNMHIKDEPDSEQYFKEIERIASIDTEVLCRKKK